MALAITSPTPVITDTSNVTSYVTASFTPTANSLLLVFCAAQASIATGSISGGSLTWTLLNRVSGGGDTEWCWYAQVGASPSSMTITLDLTGDAATGAFIKTFQITGHDSAAPIAQSVFSTGKTTGANPAFTMPGSMNTNNLYVGAVFNNTNPFASTPPTSWTEVDDTGFGTPATGITTAYRINGETGTSVTFTAVSSTWFGGVVEISVAPPPAAGLVVTEAVAAINDTSNVTSYASSSFTPAANSLLVVFIHAYNADLATGSLSGGSLTWVLIDRNPVSTPGNNVDHWAWYAQVGASPSSMTVTFDCTGDASTGVFGMIYQVTGHNTVSPIVQKLIGQTGSGQDPSFTLPQNMNTNNAYMYMLVNSTALTMVPPTGWTETDDVQMLTPTAAMESAYRVNGESGNTISWTSLASPWQFSFIEIAAVTQRKGRLTLLGVG